MSELSERQVIILKDHCEPHLLNSENIEIAPYLLLYRLPPSQRNETETALQQLPYPVVTIKRSIPSAIIGVAEYFPADIGCTIDRKLYITKFHWRILKTLLELDHNTAKSLKKSEDLVESINTNFCEGGKLVLESSKKVALVAEDPSLSDLLQGLGYNPLSIPKKSLRVLESTYRQDWVCLGGHIDPLATLFMDKLGSVHLKIDEMLYREVRPIIPSDWKTELIDHWEVLRGVLNLAYVEKNVLAPVQLSGSQLAGELEEAGYNLIYLPPANVSEKAGPKCRTLVIPLLK